MKVKMMFISLFVGIAFFMLASCGDRTAGSASGGSSFNAAELVDFPEEEILGASYYRGDKWNGEDYKDTPSYIVTKNDDGSWHFKVALRQEGPSKPVALFFTGSFTYEGYYNLVCTFPETSEYKPYRVYACASTNLDPEVDSDYPTAWDSQKFAAFPSSGATGVVAMSNETIAPINPKKNKIYKTIWMYLYFNGTPGDWVWYEFDVNKVQGMKGIKHVSPVTKMTVARTGGVELPLKAANIAQSPYLSGWDYKYDTGVLTTPISTDGLTVNFEFGPSDAGKVYKSIIRIAEANAGSDKKLSEDDILSSYIDGETPQNGVITEQLNNQDKRVYYILSFTVPADGNASLVIPCTYTGTDINRLLFTINLDETYTTE